LGYWGVRICQNSANAHLRFMDFIVCKFYIKEKMENKYWKFNNRHSIVLRNKFIIYLEMHQKLGWIDEHSGLDRWTGEE
jgi:hypothetical protein